MAPRRGGGRRAGAPATGSHALDDLVLLLQDARRQARLSVEDVHRQLEAAGNLDVRLPGLSTLYRKLQGFGLKNERRLVEAVIAVCIRDDQRAAVVLDSARELLHQAWSEDAEQAMPPTAAAEEPESLRNELIQTQRDLIDAQSRLVAAERTAAQAEIDAARTRTLLMAVALALVADREGAATRVPGRPDTTDGVRTAPEERAASGRTDLSVEQEKPSASSASSEQLLGLQADSASHEAAMAGVIGEIRRLDSDGSRMRGVVDSAGLHVLDPVHTGRYRWSQLTKIEKSSLGGIVLNRLQREFGFNDGRSLDLEIAGHEVDLKFTLGSNWTVPAEAVGALCLLLHADDSKGVWSMGLIRAEPGVLSGGANRDGKRTLSAEGLAAVRWIHRNLPLPAHALKQLPQEVVNRIFAKQWGQSRTEELFRSAGLTPITRADLDAVAMQQDSTKRVRTIRQEMASRGILVLSGSLSSDVYRAQALGLPIPAKDAWLSVRLVPAPEQRDGAPVIMLGGDAWCVAQPGDPEAPLPPGSLARAG